MRSRFIPYLAIIAVTALVGLSLAKVSSGDSWTYSIGAAALALIAVAIATPFRQQTSSFQKSTPSRKTLGMRFGTVGFVIAICGWLVGVFLSPIVGYYVVTLGVFTGFLGLLIHFYNMFRS